MSEGDNLSPGARAVASFELEEIFLISTECWVARDYNPTAPIVDFVYGHRSAVEDGALIQERIPVGTEAPIYVLRYFVDADIRVLKPGMKFEEHEPTDEQTLAVVKMKMGADYRCPKEMAEDIEVVGAFTRNVQYHVWPYIRESAHSFFLRLRIPRLVLPMMRPEQPTRK